MKKPDFKDIAERAGKTFLQAFIPVLLAELGGSAGGNEIAAIAKSALLSAAAAGLSAVWNLIAEAQKNG